MRKSMTRFWLLNKRLFKTYSFLLILCLVPALVLGVRLGARQESGIVRIAICLQNPQDALSARIAGSLRQERDVLRYVFCDTREEAVALVERYEADAAWIFPDDMKKAMEKSLSGKRIAPLVDVVQRDDDIALIFSREVLCSAIYPSFSYGVYEDFVRNELGFAGLDEETLREAYERTLMEGSLFEMAYLDGETPSASEDSYLLTPIRGLLALWLVLCGMAGSMYFVADAERGVYDNVPVNARLGASFGLLGVILADGCTVALAAYAICGVFTSLGRELLCMAVFACSVAAFGSLFRLLLGRLEWLGSCIPLLMMGMLVLCPVFLDVRGWRALRLLLPPYYYLRSIHSDRALWEMAGYTIVLLALCVLADRVQSGRSGRSDRQKAA